MRKSIFFACAALMLASCAQHRPESVENPEVLFTNASDIIDVTKVVSTDSSTVLYFDATFRPGWWITVSENSCLVAGTDTLPLLMAEGIEPGAEHVMPESGKDSFALTFGPLAADVSSVTFTEGNGGWIIAGIDLMGHPSGLPSVPASLLRASDSPVNTEPELSVADTRFEIHIMDYLPEMGNKIKVMIAGLGGRSFEETLDLDGKGVAEFEAPVYGTSRLFVQLPNLQAYAPSLIVAPGGDNKVYIDPRFSNAASLERRGLPLPNRYVYDNGRYASLNAALALTDDFSIDYFGPDFADAWTVSPEQFTDRLLNKRDELVEKINNLEADRQFKEYLVNSVDLDVLSAMAQSTSVFANSFYASHRNFEGNWRDSVPSLPGKEEYTRVLEKIDAANPAFMGMSYSPALDIDWTEYGAGSQVAQARMFIEKYEEATNGTLSDAEIAELNAIPGQPFYAEAAADRNRKMQEKLKSLAALVQPVPEVADTEVFDAIVAPYKGKVVLVDLWNTWCGPCRRALAANEPLKSGELSDSDIIWIYIADESSDPSTYSSMLPDIKGIHYRVDSGKIKAIRERFNVDGIPYYILVDREGNAVGHPDFRDHSKLVEGIKGAL